MSYSKFYKPLVASGPRRADAPDEATYHELWTTHAEAHQDDLLAMAVVGGLVSDRLAWVFAAGYQAACRRAFPHSRFDGWVAYAATEDRRNDPPLPGVTIDDGRLSGSKTWVAAAAHLNELIIKVGTGDHAAYLRIPRSSAGLTIDNGEPKSFLSELTQGRAHFDATPFTADQRLDRTAIRNFRLFEPLYIYAAFCGHVMGSTTEHDLVTCSRDCLDGVEAALQSVDGGELDRYHIEKADARAQDLLVRLTGNRVATAGDWDVDQRLVAMYSRGLRTI